MSDQASQHENRLARETSPYLLQHKDNPVHWRPWGAEALAEAKDDAGALKEFQRAISIDPELDEAQRLTGLAFGRQGQQARGFYHLALSARLRGDLEQALSHFEKCDELEPDGTPRKKELADAIDELEPLVRDRVLERRERRNRRGLAVDPFGRRLAR